MAIRWARGLLRLWIVLSTVWVLMVGADAIINPTTYVPAAPAHTATDRDPRPTAAEFFAPPPQRRPWPLWAYAIEAALPPALLFAMGAALVWTISGFSPRRAVSTH